MINTVVFFGGLVGCLKPSDASEKISGDINELSLRISTLENDHVERSELEKLQARVDALDGGGTTGTGTGDVETQAVLAEALESDATFASS